MLTLQTALPISAVKSSKKGSLPCSLLKSLIHRLSTPKSAGSALDICDRFLLQVLAKGTRSSFDGCVYSRSVTVLGQTRVERNHTVTTPARRCRRLRCMSSAAEHWWQLRGHPRHGLRIPSDSMTDGTLLNTKLRMFLLLLSSSEVITVPQRSEQA